MKYLLSLLLFLAVPAIAQNTCNPSWCVIGVAISVNGVPQPGNAIAPPGSMVSVTVSFKSTNAVTGATLDTQIYDPVHNQVPGAGSWQTGVNFAAGETIVATPLVFTAPLIPGTYTIAAGTFGPLAEDPANLWDGAAETFSVQVPAPPPPVVTLSDLIAAVAKLQADVTTMTTSVNAKIAALNAELAILQAQNPSLDLSGVVNSINAIDVAVTSATKP